jgi:hypothetical protein
LTPRCRPRSKDPIDLAVRCSLPRTRSRRRPRAAACNTEAMQLHLDEIATKITPGAHAILLLDQAGWHGAKHSRFQATSHSCSSRHARPNSTAKKISGNSCGRTGCRTEFSNPSTTSSITAATPGTRSSIGRGKSRPSRAAIGQPQVLYIRLLRQVVCRRHRN